MDRPLSFGGPVNLAGGTYVGELFVDSHGPGPCGVEVTGTVTAIAIIPIEYTQSDGRSFLPTRQLDAIPVDSIRQRSQFDGPERGGVMIRPELLVTVRVAEQQQHRAPSAPDRPVGSQSPKARGPRGLRPTTREG